MADKTQFDLKKVENDVRNKAFPEENLCEIINSIFLQKINFSKGMQNLFCFKWDSLCIRKKDVLYLKESANSSLYMMFMMGWGKPP